MNFHYAQYVAQVPQPALPVLTQWRFVVDIEKIGWLTIDTPQAPVNTLSRQTIAELETLLPALETLAAEGRIVGVVLQSEKPSGFIAGADITEFDAMSDPAVLTQALNRTHTSFERLEKLKVPVVCAIHGFALGGGLEIALACHWRIAVDDPATKIGFPEVKLGIFPGFGGTGRSIRQAGPIDAMQLMLTGRFLSGKAAKRMGLVDKLVRHRDMLHWEARRAVLSKRQSPPAPLWKRTLLIGPVRARLAEKLRAETSKKARAEHYPAPHALIDLFADKGGNWKDMSRGEVPAFSRLLGSDSARQLRRVFFLSEGLKKQGLRGKAKPEFRRVHVVGAGVMGGDIAAWCALRGFGVTLQDLDTARISPALERAKALFKKRLKSKAEVDAAVLRLTADPEGRGLARADVVIEAVVEKLEIKQQIFRDAEAHCRPDAILASNTSSIPLERIAEGLTQPSRLIGLHFFNPVAQLPLVEVIRSSFNDDHAIGMGASFALAIGKSPVIVRSAPGFLVNRVLMPYMLAAVRMVDAGTPREIVDAAAETFGMPMGPIELMDTVGLDVGKFVAEELGQPVPPSSEMARLIAEGKLGRKSGAGFYTWTDGKPVKAEPPPHPDLAGLGRQLLQPLVDATEAAVADGIVGSADLADIGIILGTGFAPFLGGPLAARASGRA
jgi:3-hydroxyacyl-CoA dehydrogenase/enoyl-CoA hydratase/3-hydroxybutyryl-CoA epimerase